MCAAGFCLPSDGAGRRGRVQAPRPALGRKVLGRRASACAFSTIVRSERRIRRAIAYIDMGFDHSRFNSASWSEDHFAMMGRRAIPQIMRSGWRRSKKRQPPGRAAPISRARRSRGKLERKWNRGRAMARDEVERTHTETEQKLLAVTERITQQERIVSSLRDGPGRVEALSTLTVLLREQYDCEVKLRELRRILQRDGQESQS